MKHYFAKMRGGGSAPPVPGGTEIAFGFIGSCVALYVVGLLHTLSMDISGLPLIMAPFGASAVLVFGAFRSPLAQPRNVIGGHVLSAIVGVTVYQCVGDNAGMAVSLAVPAAIALMHLTKTLHPPGGATALIAVVGSPDIHALGYTYALVPATLGPLILLAVALLVNNLPRTRHYPEIWF